VVDLGWKLAAVLQGWGGTDLLKSYGIERRPVALRNVAASTENLGRMLATRERKPPPEVFQPGPAADAIKGELEALAPTGLQRNIRVLRRRNGAPARPTLTA